MNSIVLMLFNRRTSCVRLRDCVLENITLSSFILSFFFFFSIKTVFIFFAFLHHWYYYYYFKFTNWGDYQLTTDYSIDFEILIKLLIIFTIGTHNISHVKY